MDPQERQRAIAALRYLCVGAQIVGLRFAPTIHLLLDDVGIAAQPSRRSSLDGEASLRLESRWSVFPSMAAVFPHEVSDLGPPSVEEQLRLLCALRERVITALELGRTEHHMILTLDTGEVLFVNGHDERYECWELHAFTTDSADPWLIVAGPGNRVDLSAPKGSTFDRAPAKRRSA